LLARRPAEHALEHVRRLLDQARLLPHAARHPVERAQVVQDRAADAELRVGGERRLLPGIVLADGVEEPDDAPRHQVVHLDVRRLARRQALHHTPHERQVPAQHLLLAAAERRVGCGTRRAAARAAARGGAVSRPHHDRLPSARSRRKKNCTPPLGPDGGRVARRSASCTSARLAGAPGAASSTGSCSPGPGAVSSSQPLAAGMTRTPAGPSTITSARRRSPRSTSRSESRGASPKSTSRFASPRSASSTHTRSPCRASATARLAVRLVFPTPPFPLATAITRRRASAPAAAAG